MNEAVIELHSLRKVPAMYKTLFKEDLPFSEVVDVAEMVLKEIGNFHTAHYLFTGRVCNYLLKLPCAVKTIEWVCSVVAPSIHSSNIFLDNKSVYPFVNVFDDNNVYVGRIDALNIEDYKLNISPNIVSKPVGSFINFRRKDNETIETNITDVDVSVAFTSVPHDDDGYPLVEDKAITAIAYFIRYLGIDRGYYMRIYNENQVERAKRAWEQWCGIARVGESFTANEMDAILDSKVTFNRKQYGLPFRTK